MLSCEKGTSKEMFNGITKEQKKAQGILSKVICAAHSLIGLLFICNFS